MKKLTVGFSSHKGSILSWLIKLCLGTKYSHVYVKFYSESLDINIIYQASGLAVNMIGEPLFLKKNKVIAEKEFEIDEETYSKTIRFAITKCGEPYSIMQLFGMAYIQFASLFGFKVRNPFPNGRADYVCSELVAELLKKFKETNFEDLDSLDPKDIYKAIM